MSRAGGPVLASMALALVVGFGAPAQAAPEAALTPGLATELRACLRKAGAVHPADAFGTARVAVRGLCPELAARLDASPLPGVRGRWLADDGSMSLRQLGDLVRLVEAATAPPTFAGQLSSPRLALILDSLDPDARGELSTRARLARWWRSVVGEFDPSQRRQRDGKRRIAWPLGLWSTVSWVAAATAALLVVSVLVQEIRAALALRFRGRRAPVSVVRRAERPADLAAIDALPPRERAGALLAAVAARLHARGALAPPDPMTPREVGGGARLPEAERDGLRLIAAVGEAGAYGRQEPTRDALAAARAAAMRWLGGGRRGAR